MKTKKQSFCKALFLKIALLTALILGGGNSAWAQKSLPYSYNFNSKTNSDIQTDGWSYTGYGSTGVATFGGVESSYCFRFYPSENTQYLYMPQLATSANDVSVSFAYKGYGSSYPVEFYVGYKSSAEAEYIWGDKITYASTAWTTFNELYPAGTAYIAIKYENSTSYYYLFVDDFSVEEDNPYKTPTSFALDSFGATSATFSWTAGNDESTWQFDYSTNPDFTPGSGINGESVSITDNPYTLTGLTTGTTYYASIRADYGGGNYSEWTDKVSFTPRAEIETTINDGSNTNANIPFNGNAANSASNASQFIIPSSQLTAVNGRQITKLVFYCSGATKSYGDAKWEIYMKETSATSFGSNSFVAYGTKVFNAGTISVSDYLLSITLDTPYNYNGGNLMIGFKTTVKGSYAYTTFYGVNAAANTNNGLCGTNSTPSYYSFYPKMTITTVPVTTAPVQMGANGYTTFACPRPLDLSSLPKGLTAYKATVDAANSRVQFTKMDQTVPANTGMLLEGTAGKTYAIPVADSGTTPDGNVFLVNSTGSTFSADGDYTYFAMKKASSASDVPIFATFNPSSVAIPTNKAYLKVLTTSLGDEARQLICVFNEEGGTTGINTVQGEGFRKNSFYNLQGQRVDNPTKGLYIKDGKKVILK